MLQKQFFEISEGWNLLRSDKSSFDNRSGILDDIAGSKKHTKVFDDFSIGGRCIIFYSFFEVSECIQMTMTNCCLFDVNTSYFIPDIQIA